MTTVAWIAAIGSSYAAGPGIPPVANLAAMRSGANYAHLLAERLGARLTDLTVSGATTETILDEPQTAWNGVVIPPQTDALPADADLVTVTAGGNDLGYIGAAMSAATRAADPGSDVVRLLTELAGASGTNTPDSSAAARAADPGSDVVRLRTKLAGASETNTRDSSDTNTPDSSAAVPTVTDVDVDRTATGIARVVDVIHERAPRARVLLVDYLTLFGPSTTPEAAAVRAEDLEDLRAVQTALETAFARAASRTAVELLTASELSRDHALGSPEPWVTGLVPNRQRIGGSYHPNAAGMRAVADALAELVA